ncbi:MAG: hypothetical protein RTU92_07260 [Candidatus Thorarchaeota archaeon]
MTDSDDIPFTDVYVKRGWQGRSVMEVSVSWPNACIGCGTSDYVGITVYDLEIGSKGNYPHDTLSGKGRVYLCNQCKDFAVREQQIIRRSRMIGLLASYLLVIVFISVWSGLPFLSILFYIPIPMCFGVHVYRVWDLEPFLSYLNIARIKSKAGFIRIELRNPNFAEKMRLVNSHFQVRHVPCRRLAKVRPSENVPIEMLSSAICLSFLLLGPFFIQLLTGDLSTSLIIAVLVSGYILIGSCSYLLELVYLRRSLKELDSGAKVM